MDARERLRLELDSDGELLTFPDARVLRPHGRDLRWLRLSRGRPLD